MELIGKRIKIRDLSFNDLDDYYAYASDQDVARLAGFKPISNLETAKIKLTGLIFNNETYAICLNNRLIGTINLYHDGIRKIRNIFTIGISLGKKYWHLGYGSEAIRLIVCYAFKEMGAQYLEIRHEINNLQSKKMIEKLGFTYDGTLLNYAYDYKKELYSICLYSLSKKKFMEKIYLWENC